MHLTLYALYNVEVEQMIIAAGEIEKAIGKLKTKKAPVSDKITPETLKEGRVSMVKILKRIFQKMLSTEDTPPHFSNMLVTPVFNKSDSWKPENYRAITFLSVPGYVFNKIILKKIIEKTERFTGNTQRL